MSAAERVDVRITNVIANEYADRMPEFVPKSCWIPGVHRIPVDSAKFMRSDAEDYASGMVFDDVRPGLRRAYGALAKQLDDRIARVGGAA